MIIVSTLQEFFDSLDAKQFYTYMGSFFGALFILMISILIYYYYASSSSQEQIQELNSMRNDVEKLLSKAQMVDRQRSEVKKALAENENFKIAEYWETLLNELKLTNKQSQKAKIEKAELEDTYQEDILIAHFVDMTMKELTELLDALDKKPLVSTKTLEINQSKKRRNTIEVSLTIATPRPKVPGTE
jgi:hypothetical protein